MIYLYAFFISLLFTITVIEVNLLFIGSELVTQSFSIAAFAPIALRYAVGILTLFLKNSLTDLIVFSSTEKAVAEVKRSSVHPLNYRFVSNLVSEIQVENNNRRAYFLLPMVNMIFDLVFILLMIFYFGSKLTLLDELWLLAPFVAGVFLFLSWLTLYLGKLRLKFQGNFATILTKSLVSSFVDNERLSSASTRRSNARLQTVTSLVNTVSQSSVSIAIVCTFLLCFVYTTLFDLPLSFASPSDYVFDVVFTLALYQPLLKVFRSVVKIPIGLASQRRIDSYLRSGSGGKGQDIVNTIDVKKTEQSICISTDAVKYWDLLGLRCPPSLTLKKGTVVKIKGPNGAGKSTYLWSLFRAAQRFMKVCYIAQNVVFHSAKSGDIEGSGGEHTFNALAEAFVGGYELLLLDEPVNNLDPDHLDVLNELISNFQGAIIVVDHSNSIASDLVEEL